MPPNAFLRYGEPICSNQSAALNVLKTGSEGDQVNGLLQEIDVSDLQAFREREIGYHLASTEAYTFTDNEPILAPVYILERRFPFDGGLPNIGLLPHEEYVKVCMEGAETISSEFLDMFLATTFLADLRTSLESWMNRYSHA